MCRIIMISDYLSPSEPISQILNILNFKKLVVQRISLLMFKIYKLDVLNIYIRANNSYHSHNTRRSDNPHTPVGLAFIEFKYGIISHVMC